VPVLRRPSVASRGRGNGRETPAFAREAPSALVPTRDGGGTCCRRALGLRGSSGGEGTRRRWSAERPRARRPPLRGRVRARSDLVRGRPSPSPSPSERAEAPRRRRPPMPRAPLGPLLAAASARRRRPPARRTRDRFRLWARHGSTLRANPCPEVTDLTCRLPLPTLIYRPEAEHLGDLLRSKVRTAPPRRGRAGLASQENSRGPVLC